MDIIIDCLCADGDCSGKGLIVAIGADLNAWRAVAHNVTGLTCPDCGCAQDLSDGTTHIAGIDKATPRIDSISPIQGFAATTATIRGHRLDFGSLVVKFGDAVAIIQSRTEDSVVVTIPSNTQGFAYDVSVQNEFGCRPEGGTLTNAFTYLA